jgi:hypothetical protein
MSYAIECDGPFSSSNATEADLHHAFDDDNARGGHIIFAAPDETYIQAAGEGDGPYVMEYRTAGDTANYHADRQLSKEEVRAAFVQFFRGDSTWRTSRQWKREENTGCMSVILFCALFLATAILMT